MNTPPEKSPAPPRAGVVQRFTSLLRENLWWWLVPTLLLLAVFSAFLLFGGAGVSPFIYSTR